jgi:hypothetical protein
MPTLTIGLLLRRVRVMVSAFAKNYNIECIRGQSGENLSAAHLHSYGYHTRRLMLAIRLVEA